MDEELRWYEDRVANYIELDERSSNKNTKARIEFWTEQLEDYKKGVKNKVKAPMAITDFGSGPGKR